MPASTPEPQLRIRRQSQQRRAPQQSLASWTNSDSTHHPASGSCIHGKQKSALGRLSLTRLLLRNGCGGMAEPRHIAAGYGAPRHPIVYRVQRVRDRRTEPHRFRDGRNVDVVSGPASPIQRRGTARRRLLDRTVTRSCRGRVGRGTDRDRKRLANGCEPALCRARTDDPLLTMERRRRHQVVTAGSRRSDMSCLCGHLICRRRCPLLVTDSV